MPNILLEGMESGLPIACSNRNPMPEALGDAGVYFDPEIVDDIARALRELIDSHTLRAHYTRAHPYQVHIPEEYKKEDRWFLLNTNLDPPGSWDLNTELPVMALARVIAQSNQREWLVYAHAPVGPHNQVQIEIPEFKKIVVDVPVAGAFYHVRESDGILRISANQGGPTAPKTYQ